METERPIASILSEFLRDNSIRFVFPSAVASGFWAERAAEIMLAEDLMSGRGQAGAVDLDRFIAWDDFKAATLAAERNDRRASNGATRSLFSASLLAENAEAVARGSALLSELISPMHAASFFPFIQSLARMLPALDGLFRRPQKVGGFGGDPYFADLAFVRDRYRSFLETNRLFEAAWDRVGFRRSGITWVLIFPELAEDWHEYADELSVEKGIRIFETSTLARPGVPPPPSLRDANGLSLRFRTGKDEIAYLAAAVRALIGDDGILPSDIAVSIARVEDYAERLAQEFRIRDIPLDLRAGIPLADHAVGRFLQAMAECRSSRWSFRSLKDLLLDAAFPWKDDRSLRDLIDFGLKYRCVSGYAEDGKDVDVWIRSFDRFRDREGPRSLAGLRAFYLRLKGAIEAILSAADFRELHRALIRFEHDWLVKEEMDASVDSVFSRVIAELASLAETEESLSGIRIRDHFALFMTQLRSIEYVFQGKTPGVRVYNYRVAAGIEPAAHFILNLTQDAATVRAESVPFLREDRKRLAQAQERDLSSAFIRAYALSGKAVVFFAADRGWSGPSIPHAGLSRLGAAPSLPPVYASPRVEEDPVELERALALGRMPSSPLPSARGIGPTSVQRAARGKALSLAGSGKHLDLRRDPVGDQDLSWTIRDRLTRSAAGARISPTDLDEFAACPYSWFLRRGLGIREKETEIATVDQRELGSLYHRVFERLFTWIRETDVRFRSDRLDSYKQALGRETDAALAEASADEGAFQESVYGMLRERLYASLSAYLDADSIRLDGATIAGAELPLRLAYDEVGLSLSGLADLVALKNDGSYVVVDFKTGKPPRATDLVCDGSGAIADFQLASYVRMIEASDPAGTAGGEAGGVARVSEARFYSIDYRKFLPLIDDLAEKRTGSGLPMNRDEFGSSLSAVDDAVQAVAGALEGAHYPVPPPGSREVCLTCRVSTVCRLPFAGGEL